MSFCSIFNRTGISVSDQWVTGGNGGKGTGNGKITT